MKSLVCTHTGDFLAFFIMKKALFVLIFVFLTANLFAFEFSGVVIDNNVRIRDKPSLNSKVVGKLNKGNQIKIFDYSGSGKFDNGVLDYWACISEDKKVWINAWWITETPQLKVFYNDTEITNSEFGTARLNQVYATFHNFLNVGFTLNEYHGIIPKSSFEEKKYMNGKDGEYSYYGISYFTFQGALCGIEIGNPAINLLGGIHVGMDFSEFDKIFDLGLSQSTDFYEEAESIRLETAMGECFYIYFENYKISQIKWDCGR